MKEKFNIIRRFQGKSFIFLWITFHAVILLYFLIRLGMNGGQLEFDADLFNLTPRNTDSLPITKTEETLSASIGNSVFILIANPDFEKARETAEQVYGELNGHEYFTSVSLYNDMNSYSGVSDFLFKYRWNLLDEKSIETINSPGGAQEFADEALSKAYGLFTLSSMDNLEDDPFMLTESGITNYLGALKDCGTSMTLKDGMLSSEYEGKWYIMIRCTLSKKGCAIATKDNGVNRIYAACESHKNEGTEFIYSGTPFHSSSSSIKASKEITVISIISVAVLLIMLTFIFRTGIPILYSMLSIVISVASAFTFTVAVFSKVMILTMVFGTSLIGSCIDYSLHYFTQWAGNPMLKSSGEIRSHLFSGLRMAIISSTLCYAILLFAPFELLRQISLFSLTGLLSSFLTTICIFPMVRLPNGPRKLRISLLYDVPKECMMKTFLSRAIVILLTCVSIVLLIANRKSLGIENKITNYYSLEGKALSDENMAAEIIRYNPMGWFIISGDSEADVLSNEESFRKKLSDKRPDVKYLSTTLFIPSIERQKQSRDACRKLLELSESQYESLGFDASCAEVLKKEFKDSENDFISFENGNIPESLMDTVSKVNLGQIGDMHYTVIFPNMITEEPELYALADEDENVIYVNKRTSMNSSMDKITKMVIMFFAIAYVIMFFLLKFFYSWKQCVKIISIPILIALNCCAVLAATNTKLEFFSITGLILVFGLGLDYVIYMIENEKNRTLNTSRLEPFATTLSFATTLISFGALSLSSFEPVHLIGLTITIGLTTAFICSKCFKRI